ncbi:MULTISPECIES: hypothetical protein [unclassified Corallococcus]|uniref:hypothetical protein n=1 Tax=unclassified Corallococcus TaxID=2685029 RepID=UPI001A8E475A|nr:MULTISPECIES: hypothetical protein [unclassified Corallococcus]MBN9685392.1 hypothetical protein [Corallococcus sp. NCSPR001]WAS83157.1 hypothetical protein O0N60_28030 [Corallococcus sp. NCRR]
MLFPFIIGLGGLGLGLGAASVQNRRRQPRAKQTPPADVTYFPKPDTQPQGAAAPASAAAGATPQAPSSFAAQGFAVGEPTAPSFPAERFSDESALAAGIRTLVAGSSSGDVPKAPASLGDLAVVQPGASLKLRAPLVAERRKRDIPAPSSELELPTGGMRSTDTNLPIFTQWATS